MSVAITDDNFEAEVLKSDTPVVVDFWAEWCGPCKALSPVLADVEAELAGRVKVAKVNIEAAPQTPAQYGIRGVPTLMVFKGGELAATHVGALPKAELKSWIEENL